MLLGKLENVHLIFGNNWVDSKPLNGLKNGGPYDGKIRLGLYVLYPQKWERTVDEFLKDLENAPLSENLFEDFNVEDMFWVKRGKDYAEDSIVNKVLEWRKSASNRDERFVILQIIERHDSSPKGPYWELRKSALSKFSSVPGLPVQTVTRNKIMPRNNKGRYRAVIDNLLLALYGKAGFRPWVLKEPVSDLFRQSIYVGYDISYSEVYGQRGMGGVVVFDAMGQVIDYFETEVQVDGGDKISRASFTRVIEDIIRSANVNDIEPDLIVIHRDGNFKPSELQIIREHFNEKKMKYIFLNFPKRYGSFPVFSKHGHEIINLADEGTFFNMGYTLVNNELYLSFMIQTYPPSLSRDIAPNGLRYTLIDTNIPNLNPDKLNHDIANQIYRLSKINYASKFGVAKHPITIHYAHKMGQIKRNNISLAPFKKGKVKPLLML